MLLPLSWCNFSGSAVIFKILYENAIHYFSFICFSHIILLTTFFVFFFFLDFLDTVPLILLLFLGDFTNSFSKKKNASKE